MMGVLRELGIPSQSSGRLPAVHDRQREIHEDEIRSVSPRRLHAGRAVGGRHEIEVVLQQLGDELEVQRIVLCDQDLLHGWSFAFGAAEVLRPSTRRTQLTTW